MSVISVLGTSQYFGKDIHVFDIQSTVFIGLHSWDYKTHLSFAFQMVLIGQSFSVSEDQSLSY